MRTIWTQFSIAVDFDGLWFRNEAIRSSSLGSKVPNNSRDDRQTGVAPLRSCRLF